MPDCKPSTAFTDWCDQHRRSMANCIKEFSKPTDMILHCPRCHTQHIDAPEPLTGWNNPPHKSHQCSRCLKTEGIKVIWRPADIPTNGVAVIKTRGADDTWPVINGNE